MPQAGEPIVQVRAVTKGYHGLRPLRIQEFDLQAGQSVALIGLDAAMAEVFVNLITATSLPDSGEVSAFGRSTRDIADGDAWLTVLDRFGLVTDRAVLVEQLTAEQSLVMPLSLELHEMPADVRAAADRLVAEVGLSSADRTRPVGQLDASARLRARLGRALALDPHVLLAEHPNATLSAEEAARFAADFRRIVSRRGMAAVVITADRGFAEASADEVLVHQPATGVLKAPGGWRKWFAPR